MQLRRWLTVACCFMGAACGGQGLTKTGSGGGGGGGSGSTGSGGGSGQCSTPPVTTTRSDCPRKVCGLNGIWMGGEVSFRTLRLKGENERGLRILRVENPHGEPMTIQIDGDTLAAKLTSSTSVPTLENIKGASLFLGPTGGSPTYRLTITDVTTEPFSATCDTGRCIPASDAAKKYKFTTTRVGDGCPVRACDPSLSDHPDASIAGVAAIFRGDYYDDATYGVSEEPPPDPLRPNEKQLDLFNIACEATDIYKLYMLRHTRASAASSDATTTVGQRTSLLHALAATYCGDGHPYTNNGVPIELNFNPARSPYVVTPASGYQFTTGVVDALWSDSMGSTGPAMCIDTQRVPLDGARQVALDACRPGRCTDLTRTDYYVLSARAR